MKPSTNNKCIKNLNLKELKRGSILKIIGGSLSAHNDELQEFQQGMDKVVRKKPG